MEVLHPTKEGQDYINKVNKPFNFFMAMLLKLPSVVFWGGKVVKYDHHECAVSMPYRWTTQNPFRSTYFAAQAGIGELTTGLLCQMAFAGRGKWSMLVVNFEMKCYKKVNETITFRCDQGQEVMQTIREVEKTGKPKELVMVSTALNSKGVKVSECWVTWSFKQKSS